MSVYLQGLTRHIVVYVIYQDQIPIFMVFITIIVIVHDDVIKLKHFLRYWPFVRGIHRSRVNSPHFWRHCNALPPSSLSLLLLLSSPLQPQRCCKSFQTKFYDWQPGITRLKTKARSRFLGRAGGGDSVALKHWGRDKMDAISQTTFSNAFSWMKIYEFCLRFLWKLFLMFKITIFQHWFR